MRSTVVVLALLLLEAEPQDRYRSPVEIVDQTRLEGELICYRYVQSELHPTRVGTEACLDSVQFFQNWVDVRATPSR